MFFRNLTFFRFPFPEPFAEVTRDGGLNFGGRMTLLEDHLRLHVLKPVGPMELATCGFVSPYGHGDTRLVARFQLCDWITVGGEVKILPAAAINAELAKKLEAIETSEGRKPGGRERKHIKQDLIAEMLPRALVKPHRVDAYLDGGRGLLVVDTASRRVGEAVVSELRHALGSFTALPLNAEVDTSGVLTGWLAGAAMPDLLTLGDSAILKDRADRGASVRFQNQQLDTSEVAQHLETGKQATRLDLYHECGLSFTLDEDLVLRKVRYHDELIDALESQERDDLHAELDARFVLMAGAIGALFDTLEEALKLSKGED